MSENFAGLSFTGDGKTPSALEAFDNARKLGTKPVSFGVEASATGG